jgi:mannobiose 2-epimerase
MSTTTYKAALQQEFKTELKNILSYWDTYTIDQAQGGFLGEVTNDNQPIPGAIKGSVLNARILWSFAAAYNLTRDAVYLTTAKRALDYIDQYFVDKANGGVYWSVNANGSPADTKKQIYALAFTIYGLAEYYKATADNQALALAIALFQDIEQHSFDAERGGYLEAFTKDWQLIDDLRLSDKDANEKKTMNTHLHVLEAYTNLYRVWPDAELARQTKALIQIFGKHIVNSGNHHLNLFMDEDWAIKGDIISYGHDIEASWLLLEAAEVLHEEETIERIKTLAVKIAHASAEGLNTDGSMSYEYEPAHHHRIDEKHWWVQAEAMVGYYNAYQLTGDEAFFDKVTALWDFTRTHIIDTDKGEWFWGINADGTLMAGYGKAGFWKCPYHNSRACIELIHRLGD